MKTSHKAAIVKAVMSKGYSKRSATNIAKATIRKMKQPSGYLTNWKDSIHAELDAASMAKKRIAKLHDQAAINKPNSMTGKIVVIPPKRD